MRRLWRGIWQIRGSIAAFLVTLGLAVLTFGYLSLVLYAAVSPVLTLVYPPLGEWRGPWVWPVLVSVALLWSFSFLVAGVIDLRLDASGRSRRARMGAYLLTLWAGALASWLVVLGTNMPARG